ncbi:MAG: hypothetical protein ACKVOQ_04295 [Cyclobacteriaceae bacterium]
MIFIASQISISSIGIKVFPASVLSVHFTSILLSIALILISVKAYSYLDKKKHRAERESQNAKRKLVFGTIALNHWAFYPNPETATDIYVLVTIAHSGRFAARADGRDKKGIEIDWYFQSGDVEQRQVSAGERFTHRLPLERTKNGIPKSIDLTLYLFADSIGSAKMDVIKIFKTDSIENEDDGRYFYANLPTLSTWPWEP